MAWFKQTPHLLLYKQFFLKILSDSNFEFDVAQKSVLTVVNASLYSSGSNVRKVSEVGRRLSRWPKPRPKIKE